MKYVNLDEMTDICVRSMLNLRGKRCMPDSWIQARDWSNAVTLVEDVNHCFGSTEEWRRLDLFGVECSKGLQ